MTASSAGARRTAPCRASPIAARATTYLLVEYGPIVLDLELRFRVHVLMQRLQSKNLPGIVDLTPGIRSLQVHCDSRVLTRHAAERAVADRRHDGRCRRHRGRRAASCTCRCRGTTRRRSSPSKVHAVGARRRAVVPVEHRVHPPHQRPRSHRGRAKRIVFDASYLVLGLGDVYLGAPVATPLDPRHRLVTTKYNPARTWTPENAVGIGGAYTVRLRHGRPRRLPVHRPHRADLEHLSHRRRSSMRASRGCCASSIRSASTR